MSMYLGDFNAGDTVRFMWNTNDSNGASITRATNGTVSVYQNGNITQITTGVTDTEDFDSLTGVHYCAIDTSLDGTFYAAGRDFAVVLSAATIDTRTVNAVLAHFSIRNRSGNVTHIAGTAQTARDIGASVLLSPGTSTGQISLSSGAVTVGTNNDKTGYTLSNAGIDAVLDRTDGIETGWTLRQTLRVMAASLAGKLSGAATTTITIRNITDSKARVTATVDADGNRSALTLDGS